MIRSNLKKSIIAIFALALITLFPSTSSAIVLKGAGATLPEPLYQKLFAQYEKETNTIIQYSPVGSGKGIEIIKNNEADFAASDAYLPDSDTFLHIPTAVTGIAVIYNLKTPEVLKLTPEVISDIFSGKITYWNNPKIKALNPKMHLPGIKIRVIHRSESSGTTFIFTDYLSKVSENWAKTYGRNQKMKWPTGTGASSNEEVIEKVSMREGSIGYTSYEHAKTSRTQIAAIKNQKGFFVLPNEESIAASAHIPIPNDTRISLTDTAFPLGYPITGLTWILVRDNQKYKDNTLEKAKTLAHLLWWITHEGQLYVSEMGYAPLPHALSKQTEALIQQLRYGDSVLH